MKVPEPRKLPSGNYFIQMRLNGVSVPVTAPTARECKRQAELIKAEHRAEKRQIAPTDKLTVRECFDRYLAVRQKSLSPLTIRGYRITQKHRFQSSLMDKQASKLTKEDCQKAVDYELKSYSTKTVKNGYSDVKTVVYDVTGIKLPRVSLPVLVENTRAFLQPEEIPVFVIAVKDTKYAVPLLLALSSLRISEISELRWTDFPDGEKVVNVRGARVLDEHNKWVDKDENKNTTSSRLVPILIPELQEAIRRNRDGYMPVMPCTQNNLRIALHKICRKNNITDVTLHGLRHSFASLCYHLDVPKKIVKEIGGWEDDKTMENIYTHIAQSDLERYQGAITEFYKSANEITNEKSEPA